MSVSDLINITGTKKKLLEIRSYFCYSIKLIPLKLADILA